MIISISNKISILICSTWNRWHATSELGCRILQFNGMGQTGHRRKQEPRTQKSDRHTNRWNLCYINYVKFMKPTLEWVNRRVCPFLTWDYLRTIFLSVNILTLNGPSYLEILTCSMDHGNDCSMEIISPEVKNNVFLSWN